MARHTICGNVSFRRCSCYLFRSINPMKACFARLKTTAARASGTKISLENGDDAENNAESRQLSNHRPRVLQGNGRRTSAAVGPLPATMATAATSLDKRRHPGGRADGLGLDTVFCDCKEAYRSKTTLEIARAFLVFKLCQLNFLVNYNKEIMKFSRKVFGKRLFERAMDATFYGHFVAGRDQVSIQPTIDRLAQFGVGSILDYSVEEDMPHSDAVEAEMGSCVSHAEMGKEETHLKQFKAYREFADRRADVESARTYFYEDEEKCDDNLKTLLDCVDVAGEFEVKVVIEGLLTYHPVTGVLRTLVGVVDQRQG